jgi:hypothetical protein
MLFLHRTPYKAVVPVGPEPRSIAAAAWSCWRRRPRSRNVTGCGATAAPDPPLCTPCPLLGRTTESAPIQTDLCDWPRLAYQGLAVGGRLGAVSPSCRSALGVPLCPRVGGRCSFPGPQAGRGRRTGLMLGAFHPCQHRPPGYDPGGLGGGHAPGWLGGVWGAVPQLTRRQDSTRAGGRPGGTAAAERTRSPRRARPGRGGHAFGPSWEPSTGQENPASVGWLPSGPSGYFAAAQSGFAQPAHLDQPVGTVRTRRPTAARAPQPLSW